MRHSNAKSGSENKTIVKTIIQTLKYTINKGINRPIEFRGLKAQYIYFLAGGLAALLLMFCILYISGTSVFICIPVILLLGGALFTVVFRLSHKYGEHGLMKLLASRHLPASIRCRTIKIFRSLSRKEGFTLSK